MSRNTLLLLGIWSLAAEPPWDLGYILIALFLTALVISKPREVEQ